MKQQLLLIAASALVLSACSARHGNEAQEQKPGTDIGIDLAWMNKAVRPGDDFFSYADGSWVKNTPIPADRSNIGGFYIADLQREKNTRDLFDAILKANPGGERQRRPHRQLLQRLRQHRSDRSLRDCTGEGRSRRDRPYRRQEAAERGHRRHFARGHRSAQRDQFLHGKPVRHLRHSGADDSGRAASLSHAGRDRTSRAGILSLRRSQDGGASNQVPRLCRANPSACRLPGPAGLSEPDHGPGDEDCPSACDARGERGFRQRRTNLVTRRPRRKSAGH